MASAGSVPFQGMAFRVAALQPNGSIVAGSATGMISDNNSLMKVTVTPTMEAGVEANPKAANGNLLISYKARDVVKRYDVQVDLGDFDPEKMSLMGGYGLVTAAAIPGRTFSDGATTTGQFTLNSPSLASFVTTDVGRPIIGIPAPVANTPTTSGTGGTLTAGTYYYVLTATNASGGETTVSNEVSIATTGSTSTVTITWTLVTGATGYNIYRSAVNGLPGSELKLASVGAVATYTDTGGSSPSGAQPTSNTTTPAGIPSGTTVASYVSGTQVIMSNGATATATGVSITLGALAQRTVAVTAPQLLIPNGPNGISLEVWSQAIVRGTGFQGTTPYPTAGSASLQSSGFIRYGIFRVYLDPTPLDIEDKESMVSFKGYATQNPNFGVGPWKDWTTTATEGTGTPIPTYPAPWAAMYDYQLPPVLSAGFTPTAI